MVDGWIRRGKSRMNGTIIEGDVNNRSNKLSNVRIIDVVESILVRM